MTRQPRNQHLHTLVASYALDDAVIAEALRAADLLEELAESGEFLVSDTKLMGAPQRSEK